MGNTMQSSSEKISFRRDLVTTAVVPLVVMGLFLLFSLLQLSNLLSETQAVDHSDQVISQAYRVQGLMVDMETGLRGYLLTGSADFLEPYQTTAPIINQQVDALGQLVADNPGQTAQLQLIRSQFGDWQQFAASVLATKSIALLDDQLQGKALMDKARQQVATLIDSETQLRTTRQQTVEQTSHDILILRLIVALVLATVLIIFFRIRYRYLAGRFDAALNAAQQKAEEALIQRDWLQGTLSSIGDGVIATDTKGNITLINRIARALTESTPEASIGKPLETIFKVFDEQTRMPVTTTGITDEQIVYESTPRAGEVNQVLLIGNAGRETPIEDSIAPIRDGRGLTLGTVFVFRDLSERRRANAQLSSSERRYRDLTNAMPLMLWTATPSGEIDYYNQQWFDYTGLTPAESKSVMGWQAALHPDDVAPALEQWQQALQTGETYEIEARWKRASDAAYLWHLGKSVPICDEHEKTVAWVGTLTNIDKQKQSEVALLERTENLEVSARHLEERNQELDQFAYITSHDLKAPLRGIANLSQWIEEDLGENANAEIHKQMELLRGRVHRMEGLIDGILQYSRVGRVKGTVETVNVATLLKEIVDLLAPPEEIAITVEPGMPVLRAERLLLQQVFSNLIGNAIKHRQNANGHITISVTDRPKFYEFSVADDGPGIPEEFYQKIFVIFQTLESRDKVEGSGLGLALIKKIVEQQGGKVWLTSQVGVGTTFYFTWPKAA